MGVFKGSVKSKYEGAGGGHGATTTISLGVGELKLKASCTDAALKQQQQQIGGGVTLGVEKPGCFMLDLEPASGDARFQFMTSARVAGKTVKLTYIHPQKRNATLLEGSLLLDGRNKVTAKYSFASGKGQLRYAYVHQPSNLTVEPWYDFGAESWNFAVSKQLCRGHSLKATYEPRIKSLGLEWTSDDKAAGQFKVAATVNVGNHKPPKLLLERTWSYDF